MIHDLVITRLLHPIVSTAGYIHHLNKVHSICVCVCVGGGGGGTDRQSISSRVGPESGSRPARLPAAPRTRPGRSQENLRGGSPNPCLPHHDKHIG